jgi:hypothetical protein
MGQLDFQAVDYFVIAEIGSGHFGMHFSVQPWPEKEKNPWAF